jgi:hypothetical protein
MKAVKFACLGLVGLTTGMMSLAAMAGQGNEMPSGAHYNLNLIGVEYKSADMDGNNGRRIFVKLWGKSTIYLQQGDFKVIDANGTDSNGATFQLPYADADCDGWSDYGVFVRELGTPGGSATMTTCLYDATDTYCSSESVSLSRDVSVTGKPKTQQVTKELLTVLYDIDGDTDLDRTPLFGDDSYGYLWEYQNSGLRLAQLRFYDEASFYLADLEDPNYNCDAVQ